MCVLNFTAPADFVHNDNNITYARFRIGPNASEIENPGGIAFGGEVEDYEITADTLPVTLSQVVSARVGDQLKVDWSTSSELFNVGFQLWGLDGADSKWEKLHNWLVHSGSGNALEPQGYTKTVKVPGSVKHLVAVGVSSVDSDGTEHYYGPFEIGRTYGDLNQLEPIAWNHIRSEVDAQMAAKGYVKDRVHGYRKVSPVVSSYTAASTADDMVAELTVSQSGMYRITAVALSQAGLNLSAVAKNEIAIVDHTGASVVRYVLAKGAGSGKYKTLGSTGSIYFYGQSPQGPAALYSRVSHYRIVVDASRVLSAPVQDKQGVSGGFSELYRERLLVEVDAQYSLAAQADDPWIERELLSESGAASVASKVLSLPQGVDHSAGVELIIGVGRRSGLTPVDTNGDGVQDPEHVITGAVSDTDGNVVWLDPVNETGTGVWEAVMTAPVVLGDVDPQTDGLQVAIGAAFEAGAGYSFSAMQLDYMGLSYARAYTAKSNQDYLSFRGPNAGEAGYRVVVPDKGHALAFAHNGDNLVRLMPESQVKQTVDGKKQHVVELATLNGAGLSPVSQPVSYWISGQDGFLSVESLSTKSAVSASKLLSDAAGANYLMVAYPAFIGPVLQQYAQHKQSQGYAVAVMDYLDIVEAYGGGQSGPTALTQYLTAVAAAYGELEHVLLVGGSVYDHTDKLGTGARSFIPGHYGESGYSKFTVSDAPYVTRSDGRLFSNIGRWPVRSIDDLKVMVDKSIAWAETDHSRGEAMLIGEHMLAGQAIDFGAALNTLIPLFPTTWSQHQVYVDQILKDNPGMSVAQVLSVAKGQIIDGLNRGPQVVLFNGHGTTSQLSNQGLFRAADVSQINTSQPALWIPMYKNGVRLDF